MRKRILLLAAVGIVCFIGLLFGIRLLLLDGAEPKTAPTASPDQQIISTTKDPGNPLANTSLDAEAKVDSVKYFEDKQWLVAYLVPKKAGAAEPLYVVMHKQGVLYQAAAGPGSSFPIDALTDANVPGDVIAYMQQLDIVGPALDE